MMTRVQLAALLGIATVIARAVLRLRRTRPVHYDPDATPSMARRTERRRRIRARAAATKRRRGWR